MPVCLTGGMFISHIRVLVVSDRVASSADRVRVIVPDHFQA
jgi:hypothetical protein